MYSSNGCEHLSSLIFTSGWCSRTSRFGQDFTSVYVGLVPVRGPHLSPLVQRHIRCYSTLHTDIIRAKFPFNKCSMRTPGELNEPPTLPASTPYLIFYAPIEVVQPFVLVLDPIVSCLMMCFQFLMTNAPTTCSPPPAAHDSNQLSTATCALSPARTFSA
ncbi:hypothetical protein BC830DRAFT_625267 [Chytriomyces sp. MP71]|nr:hypothetical protein BC830DRAFT_625267 [Chytriomyces sp. MP71]